MLLVLLPLPVAAKIVREHGGIRAGAEGAARAVYIIVVVAALPAAHHRHGVNGGGSFQNALQAVIEQSANAGGGPDPVCPGPRLQNCKGLPGRRPQRQKASPQTPDHAGAACGRGSRQNRPDPLHQTGQVVPECPGVTQDPGDPRAA